MAFFFPSFFFFFFLFFVCRALMRCPSGMMLVPRDLNPFGQPLGTTNLWPFPKHATSGKKSDVIVGFHNSNL